MKTRQNIIIVDDDPGFRKTLSDILTVKGYACVAVDKGQTALEEIKKVQPVVALIDLKLEDMSGLDLLKEIKAYFQGIECILLTGHATQKSAIEAVNLGAYGYIQKPYDVEQLLIMIRRAIEKWEADEALLAYATRLKILREIDQAILEVRSPQAIAQAALQHIQHLIPCQQASVVAFDFEDNQIILLAVHTNGKTKLEVDTTVPLDTSSIPNELRQGQVLLVQDISTNSPPLLTNKLLPGEIKAYLSAPLVAQGELIGILSLGTNHTNTFEPEHIEIAQEVASLLALAIYQARLDEQVQHHAVELEQRVAELQLAQTAEREQRELADTLREVTGVLSSSLDREQVLRIILEQLGRVVEYDGASVMLVSNDTLEIVAYRRSKSGPILVDPLNIKELPHVQKVINHRTPVIIPDTLSDTHWQRLPGTEYIRCWLGVPLVVQDRVIGLLNVNKTDPDFYTAFDAELAKTLADQAAIAVENAQLFEQAQLEIDERMRAEAALAEERALLAERVQERTAELSAANAELARAARLKDEFLAAMSHELRTPLNAVLGLSEALQEEVYGVVNDRQRKSLRTIEESGRHLLSLINDILDVSKIEAGKLTLEIGTVPVEAICQASLRLIKQAAQKKHLKITSTFDESVTTIQADQRRLKQILVNLLSNAVKFTPQGQEIGLDVRGDKSEQVINFTVWDTGIGIDPEGMEHLFIPFVQLDSSLARQHSGTGLGLTLVNRLTEMHGGGILVSSEPGKGSRFTVSLPWSEPGKITEPEKGTKTDERVEVDIPALRQAVIVEDSPAATDQMARYLQELGIEPIIHPQGEGAVDTILETQPDIIILDIMLPDVSGWKVLTHLKNNALIQNIPVLIVSVVDEPVLGLSLDAADYLVKPITRQQLQASLGQILPVGVKASKTLVVTPEYDENSRRDNPLSSTSPLILLAEDNEYNISTISSYLQTKGYQMIVARDGSEAVARAREENPDLILMDIQMPGMDGLEATRRIRATGDSASVPIIALTALTMPGDRERCLTAGANEYMSKPVSLKKLIRVIEGYLEENS